MSTIALIVFSLIYDTLKMSGDHLFDLEALRDVDRRKHYGLLPEGIQSEEFVRLSKKGQRQMIAAFRKALGLPAHYRRVGSIEKWERQHQWINNKHAQFHRQMNRNKYFVPRGDISLERVKDKMDIFATKGYPF